MTVQCYGCVLIGTLFIKRINKIIPKNFNRSLVELDWDLFHVLLCLLFMHGWWMLTYNRIDGNQLEINLDSSRAKAIFPCKVSESQYK